MLLVLGIDFFNELEWVICELIFKLCMMIFGFFFNFIV